MTLRNFALLFFSLILLSSCVVKKTPAVVDSPTSRFQIALDSIYKAHPKSVGLMVHIEAPDQNISWSGAVGLSDKKNKTTLQPDQPVLIASNTKTYTAAAILKLIEKGNLSL